MDTIHLKLDKEQAGNISFMATIPPLLSNVKYGEDEAGSKWFTGRLSNFKVIVNENSLTVKDGSLCKWFLGNNLKTMSRGDIQKAFEKMGDTLHIPVSKADVRAFHFGKNIPLKHPVSLYLPFLGSNGRYIRLEQKTALNYKITGRELSIYDKIAEIKHRQEVLPALYQNTNVLRYEKRYLHHVAGYFKQHDLKAATLYEENFYIAVMNDWHKDYLNIQKQKVFKINMDMVTTKEQMKMLGVLSLVERQGGKLAALQNIAERYKIGQLTKKQAHDLKILIHQSASLKLQTKESDLVLELDGKMNEEIKYFR